MEKTAEQEWRVDLTAVDVPQKDQIILQTSGFQTGMLNERISSS